MNSHSHGDCCLILKVIKTHSQQISKNVLETVKSQKIFEMLLRLFVRKCNCVPLIFDDLAKPPLRDVKSSEHGEPVCAIFPLIGANSWSKRRFYADCRLFVQTLAI